MGQLPVLGSGVDRCAVEIELVCLAADQLNAGLPAQGVLDALECRRRDVDQLVVLTGRDIERPGDGVASLGEAHGFAQKRDFHVLLDEPLFDQRCRHGLVQLHEDVSTQALVLNTHGC